LRTCRAFPFGRSFYIPFAKRPLLRSWFYFLLHPLSREQQQGVFFGILIPRGEIPVEFSQDVLYTYPNSSGPVERGKTVFMPIKIVTVSLLGALLLVSCGPSIRTERTAMPGTGKRGPIRLTITPGEGLSKADVSSFKQLLGDSFARAGYRPVTFSGAPASGRSVELVVTKFERLSHSDNTTMAAGLGCTYLCFFLAPCLLVPGYNEPQVEITAEVTARQSGKELFSTVLSERAKASSNAFDRGSEDLNRKLEDLAVHNLTVAIINLLDRS